MDGRKSRTGVEVLSVQVRGTATDLKLIYDIIYTMYL